MKKMMYVMSLLMVTLLVFAACTKVIEDNNMPASGDMGTEEKMMDTETKDTMDSGTEEKSMDMDTDSEDMMDDAMDEGSHMDEDMSDESEDMMDSTEDSMDSDSEDMMDDTMMNDGEVAPAFMFTTLSGETVSYEDFKGEKVYIKFWASWCPICLGGLDELDTLSAMAEGFKVISVVTPDFRGEQSAEDFKMWYDGMMKNNLTVLLDQDGAYASEFGVRAYPTSAFIGSDGVLVAVHPGHLSNDQIEEAMTLIY